MNCIAVSYCYSKVYLIKKLKHTHYSCITEKPEILQDPYDVDVSFGSNALFKCSVEGDPIPEIKWMLNSNEINFIDDTRIHISPDGETLEIDRIDERDQGVLMKKSIKIYIAYGLWFSIMHKMKRKKMFFSLTIHDVVVVVHIQHRNNFQFSIFDQNFQSQFTV